MSKALFYLSRREYSQIELENKLKLSSEDINAIKDTIEKLIQLGYQSDRRYIEAYVRYKSQKYGIMKIRYELKNKVNDLDLIDEVIDSLVINEASVIEGLITKKYTNLNPNMKNSVIRFLLNKGFNKEIVYEIVIDKFKECKYYLLNE